MIKNDVRMIKQYIYHYEYDIDYEFDVNSVNDIQDDRIKQEIESLCKLIDEYTKEK
jgi:hypothetical protein